MSDGRKTSEFLTTVLTVAVVLIPLVVAVVVLKVYDRLDAETVEFFKWTVGAVVGTNGLFVIGRTVSKTFGNGLSAPTTLTSVVSNEDETERRVIDKLKSDARTAMIDLETRGYRFDALTSTWKKGE